MATQDTSSVQLSFKAESTWGTPATGTYQILRITSEDFRQQNGVRQSQQISADRQPGPPAQVDISASGQFGFELSYGSFDEMFRGLMQQAAWPTAVAIAADTSISFANSDNSINSGSTNFVTENFVVGAWVRIAGAANSENNGLARVVSVATGKVVLSHIDLVDESATAAIDIDGATLFTGNTKQSFTFERYFTQTADYFQYPGMRVGSMSLSIRPQEIITGTFGFLGKSESTATSAYASAYTAATTGDVANAVSNITAVYENGSAITLLNQLDLTFDNGLRALPAIGVLGATEIGLGTVRVNGSVQAYFQDLTLYNKFKNFTTSEVSFVVTFNDSSVLIFDVPSIKYTQGGAPTPGNNQDVFAQMPFEAFKDATLGQTFSITRIAAP